jgi:hypothetical protein
MKTLLTLLLLASVACAQPAKINKTIPLDAKSHPYTPLVGSDGTGYKEIGMSGVIFDSTYCDSMEDLSATWRPKRINYGASTNSAGGFVIHNLLSTTIECSTNVELRGNGGSVPKSDNYFIPGGTSQWIPSRADTAWVRTAAVAPDVLIENGSVR